MDNRQELRGTRLLNSATFGEVPGQNRIDRDRSAVVRHHWVPLLRLQLSRCRKVKVPGARQQRFAFFVDEKEAATVNRQIRLVTRLSNRPAAEVGDCFRQLHTATKVLDTSLAGSDIAPQDRLRVREVSVLRRARGQIVIDGGLEAGDQVLISPLRIFTEGMALRTLETDPS